MIFFQVILFTGTIAWLFPPFRQYKTRYFYFFVVLALSDPILLALYYTFHFKGPRLYVIVSFLCIAALNFIPGDIRKLYKYILLLPVIVGISLQTEYNIYLTVVAINQFIVLVILFKHFIIDIKDNEVINLFYIVIIFYIIAILQKILFRIAYFEVSYAYTLFTNVFQLLICAYFIFFNVNNSKKFALFKNKEIA